jgi:hypothetical protein
VQGWRRLIVILATLASRRKVVAFPPARPGFSCCNGDLNVDFGLFLLQKGILMWIWIVIMVTYIIFSHMHLLVRMGWACRDLHRDISSLNKAGAISPVEHLHRQTVISCGAPAPGCDLDRRWNFLVRSKTEFQSPKGGPNSKRPVHGRHHW